MNAQVYEFLDSVRNSKKHFFVVSGNIFDTVMLGGGIGPFADFTRMLYELTAKKNSNFIIYDIFSGMRVLRGDKEEIARAMKKDELKSASKSSSDDALTKAFNQLNVAQSLSQENAFSPFQMFQKFDHILHQSLGERSIIVIQYADVFFQNGNAGVTQLELQALQTALHKWGLDEEIHKNGHLVICIGKSLDEAWGSVVERCGCVHTLRLSKPDEDERLEYLLKNLSISEEHALALAKASAGLALKEIDRLFSSLDQSLTKDQVLEKCFSAKKRLLKDEYGDVLEIMHPQFGFDAIGGLEKVIAKIKLIARAMREGKTALIPQGIAFFGPPGTGKTILAQACAKEAGVNFVRALDLKDMFVGESERRKTRFHNALRDLAPVVVFADEFDQAHVARGSFDGDSGVGKDSFKKDLEIMSDPALRGKVLFIFASNKPELIDAAFLRAGRCDLRIPFPPFEARELEKICHAALVQFPEIQSGVKNFMPFAERCEGYSGGDMVEIVRRAWERANYDERNIIIEEDMEWACEDYIPQKANEVEIARMTLLAFRACSSISLLPDNW